MTGTTDYLVELIILISRRIGVCLCTKLVKGQTCLAQRTGRSAADVLAKDGKRLPQRESLKGQYPLRIGATGNLTNQSKVAPQQRFFNDIDRSFDKIKKLEN